MHYLIELSFNLKITFNLYFTVNSYSLFSMLWYRLILADLVFTNLFSDDCETSNYWTLLFVPVTNQR